MYDCLVVSGPTASGKSALGVELALLLGGEVVCADSMQIYRGMDVGTAKTTREEMRGVPHHMMDVADPSESFSAARYAEMASACMDDILYRGRLPIVVGGTGLYIDTLIHGTAFADGPGDASLRRELEAEYDALGGERFREKLAETDPERAALLAPGDKKRLVRAREVYLLTGQTITAHDAADRARPPRYRAFRVALDFVDRQMLYDRIDRRAEAMFDAGLVAEVQGLLAAGLAPGCTAMQAIGYKEVCAHLRGEMTLVEAQEAVCRGSRRYAKRQLTWLRRNAENHWLLWNETPDLSAALPLAEEFRRSRQG